MIAKRVEFLTGYQNAAYAQQYQAFVEKVRGAEAPLNSKKLTEAVARYLFKLMAYKDEYEVARLHSDPSVPRRRSRRSSRATTSSTTTSRRRWTAKKNAAGELQ